MVLPLLMTLIVAVGEVVPFPWRRILLRGRPGQRTSSAGQSFVELVLVLPIMLVVAIAVGDFGRVYATGVAVEDAAREAADYAAFDDLGASHFYEPVPGAIDAKDSTRLEALRRACAAVSALPDFDAVAGTCSDSTARCTDTAGSFCQMLVEDHRASQPWASTCGIDPQVDITCGWIVHVTVTFDFHMVIDYLSSDFLPLPTTVNLVRESRYAVSALPGGASQGP
jgi:hypothetical protein